MTNRFPGIYEKFGKWYFRHRKGVAPLDKHPSQCRECWERYDEVMAFKPSKPRPQWTVARTIESYRSSPEFARRAPSTQRTYEVYMRRIEERAGPTDIRAFRRQHLVKMRNDLQQTPGAAHMMLAVFHVLFEHAIDLGVLTTNPARGVKRLEYDQNAHKPWPAWAIDRFRESVTGSTRTAFELALGSGQRMSDVLKMRWSDIDRGGINVKQQKTGKALWVPLTGDCIEHLRGVKKQGLTIVAGQHGRAVTAHAMRERMRKLRSSLGLEEYTFHGLRSTVAVHLAEAGKTDAMIASITGHQSMSIVAHYRRGASQEILAKAARETES